MKIDGKIYRLGDLYEKHPIKPSQLKVGESFKVVRETDYGKVTSFEVFRPPRHRDESPVAYYRRTRCVDERYFHRHRGRYYCNPAHCSRSWASKKNKKKRDEHLDMAYGALL